MRDISGQGIDANTLNHNGCYLLWTISNMGSNWPIQEVGWLSVIEGYQGNTSAHYAHQEYTVFYTNKKYIRDQNTNGTWSSWRLVSGVDKVDVYTSSYISIYDNNLVAYRVENILVINAVFSVIKNVNYNEYIIYLPDGYTAARQQITALSCEADGQLLGFPMYTLTNSRVIQANREPTANPNIFYRLNTMLVLNQY